MVVNANAGFAFLVALADKGEAAGLPLLRLPRVPSLSLSVCTSAVVVIVELTSFSVVAVAVGGLPITSVSFLAFFRVTATAVNCKGASMAASAAGIAASTAIGILLEVCVGGLSIVDLAVTGSPFSDTLSTGAGAGAGTAFLRPRPLTTSFTENSNSGGTFETTTMALLIGFPRFEVAGVGATLSVGCFVAMPPVTLEGFTIEVAAEGLLMVSDTGNGLSTAFPYTLSAFVVSIAVDDDDDDGSTSTFLRFEDDSSSSAPSFCFSMCWKDLLTAVSSFKGGASNTSDPPRVSVLSIILEGLVGSAKPSVGGMRGGFIGNFISFTVVTLLLKIPACELSWKKLSSLPCAT